MLPPALYRDTGNRVPAQANRGLVDIQVNRPYYALEEVALPPEQREELRFNGVGPGDSYVGLWRILNSHRHPSSIDHGGVGEEEHQAGGATEAGA
jgi:hypothetical protein